MEMDKARSADDHILPGPFPVYDPNIMTLRAEDGRYVDFEFVDLIEYEGGSYAALLPAEEAEGEEEGKVVILRIDVSESSEEESYVRVGSGRTLNAVFGIFKENFRDKFRFPDED